MKKTVRTIGATILSGFFTVSLTIGLSGCGQNGTQGPGGVPTSNSTRFGQSMGFGLASGTPSFGKDEKKPSAFGKFFESLGFGRKNDGASGGNSALDPRGEGGGSFGNNAAGDRIAEAAKNINTNPEFLKYLKSRNASIVPDGIQRNGAPTYYCFNGVESTLKQVYGNSFSLPGAHAWMAADQLATKVDAAGKPYFKEGTRIPAGQSPQDVVKMLNKLPRGSVVVWDRSPDPNAKGPLEVSGHIAVIMGNNQEVSDRVSSGYVVGPYGGRIFIPQQ